MNFSCFIWNLKTHEIEIKVRGERENLQRRGLYSIAFKATPSIAEDDESMDEGEEEEFAMLLRKVGKIFYKKGRMSNFRRARPQGKNERKKRWVHAIIARRRDTWLRIVPL